MSLETEYSVAHFDRDRIQVLSPQGREDKSMRPAPFLRPQFRQQIVIDLPGDIRKRNQAESDSVDHGPNDRGEDVALKHDRLVHAMLLQELIGLLTDPELFR